MRMRRCGLLILLCVLLSLLLAGCPGLQFGDPICTYSWRASAYEDLNGNGVRETDEPPLPNVRLIVKRVPDRGRTDIEPVGTGAEPVQLAPGGIGYCPASMAVSATGPRGFAPTTPTTATVTGEPKGDVAFGFRWTGGARPKPPVTGEATAYATNLNPTGEASGHVWTSNGDLWVALNGTHGPLRRYRDGKEQPFQTEGFNRACGIAADKHDVLWMGICYGGGVMRFDGESSWRRYTIADGLLSDNIYTMHRASDGSIWATHYPGFSRLDPQTEKWQALPELQDLQNPTNGPDGAPFANGALWFRSETALVSMQPSDPLKTRRDVPVPAVNGAAVNLIADPVIVRDAVWCLGSYGEAHEQVLARYELQGGGWTLYTWESTGGRMPLVPATNLDRLGDALFIHTWRSGGYKLIPGPPGDASAWEMVQYPQFSQTEPPLQRTEDRQVLEQLISVPWGGHGVRETLVK